MATPINRKKARAALQQNLHAQQSAHMLAQVLGDQAEEKARSRTIADITRKIRRLDEDAAGSRSLAVRSSHGRAARNHRRQRVDGLESLLKGQTPAISEIHFRAALALRDHVESSSGGGAEIKERVQGGSIDNCQMENLCDRRRPMRFALNAAVEAISEPNLATGAMSVILHGESLSHACIVSGVTKKGHNTQRIKSAIYEALDAAQAHIGIAA